MSDGILKVDVKDRRAIAIGIASSGRSCPVEWALALANQAYPPNTNIAWIHVVGQDIDEARNRIVEEAIKVKAKYIWFLDDDTVPPHDAARKLMYVLDQAEVDKSGVMVAGGIYCIKQDPPSPLVFTGPGAGPFWDWKVGDIFPVWAIGTGCMMINTEIFNHIEPPYFKTISEEHYSETDDLYFCTKVINAGYKITAHGGILCRHWDVSKNLIYTLPKGSYPMRKEGEQNPADPVV